MLEHTLRFTIPALYSILPGQFHSDRATAMLLAIALQESAFEHRRQIGGTACGFWQFELPGIREVIQHPRSSRAAADLLLALSYPATSGAMADRVLLPIAHNDVLAAGFARLLLWTSAAPLPGHDDAGEAWKIYVDRWKPGRPHAPQWAGHWSTAWEAIYRLEVGRLPTS